MKCRRERYRLANIAAGGSIGKIHQNISPPSFGRYAQLLRTQIVDSVTFLHQDVSLGSKVHRDEPRADGNGGLNP